MSQARLVLRKRIILGEREFVEMAIWQVPESVPPTKHGIKYRLAYIFEGRRIIGYDNERGKGDHRHIGGVELPYQFREVEKLIADFIADVEQRRRS
ncbi:MAG: hypothetical protein HQL41_14895 [Alphaproteobacteria bacterium]|nr:hypothetical protein [Alphaproteobacteria bacterium]